MTSSTTRPAWSTGGRDAEGRGYGLIIFAAVLLLVLGFFNMIYGIAAIANSHVFTANAHYVIGDLRAWGWITLILSVLQLVAAGGILAGNQLAPLVRRRRGRAERHRHDVLRPGLPVLGAVHHCRGRGRAVRAVRLRQPHEHRSCLGPHRARPGAAADPRTPPSRSGPHGTRETRAAAAASGGWAGLDEQPGSARPGRLVAA
jgi:hypothetical protein